MRQGKPLTVVKPGTQVRNFTHVDDIALGLLLVGELGHGDDFGIGSEISYTVNKVAEMFGGDVQYLDPRPGNRMNGELKTTKTLALGWTPKEQLVDWIQYLRDLDWQEI